VSANTALVLVVDDDPLNRKLMRDVLRFAGHRTAEAATARSALALAADERPDLVLMDIRLPDMSGTEALRELRRAPATARVRVLAVTASAMRGDRERLLAAGFDDYIGKPLDVRDLLRRVDRFLQPAP
jgi:CheY-like chemotaxis protein